MKTYLSFILASLYCLLFTARAEIVPMWSTGVAVPGERVVLYLVDTGIGAEDSISVSKPPQAERADVRLLRPISDVNPLDPQRNRVAIAPIQVTPDVAGQLNLGTIEVSYRSGKAESIIAPPLTVVSTGDITWFTRPVSYGALWYADTKDGYVHQPVRAHLKLFLPDGFNAPELPMLNPVGVKITDLQRSMQGLMNLVHRQTMPAPEAYARGNTWRTADFFGEFTPLREGTQGVNGGIVIERPLGLLGSEQASVPLPTLSLSALPLPPGAPADFANTAGQYSISATTNAQDLAMHEAVEVEITVRGTGNLSSIECPRPVDAQDWKLVPATRKPLLNANGQTVGMVFSQYMRPTAEVGGIPAFSLCYFDPVSMEYRRAETRPIPLAWHMTSEAGNGLQSSGTNAPPPAGEVPVEEMRSIYGFITHGSGSYLTLPRWLWYLLYLPAALVLLALGAGALRRYLAAGAAGRARDRELSRLARQNSGLDFLKAVGGFIEANIPMEAQGPELRSILARRDEEAFRPQASVTLTPAEKTTMLRQVRRALAKLATTAAVLMLMLLPTAQANVPTDALLGAEAAYNEAQYSKALSHLQSKDAARSPMAALYFYNMGNCYYQLKQPGQAALAYARALQADPGLKEARLNLAFVQRLQGAILPTHEGANAVFTFFSPQQLWVGTIVSTALLALCLALQLAWRHLPRPWLQAATALTLLLSLACAANWVYYLTRETPNFSLLPPQNLAYVVQEGAARSAASDEGAVVIALTPTSPVLLLAERGSWSYIETATGVRGWVQAAHLAPLCPEGMTPHMPLTLRF